tara:strand:+ start:1313 stop:1843 length:531 start_codon:yes stop_codon:yes gene_type:complete
MAEQYSNPPKAGDPADDFSYRKGLRKRYRSGLEDMASGKPYDAAAKSMKGQYRQMGAQQLAASGTRNIGALTDVSSQLSRQAATQIGGMELDKAQSQLGAVESLQAMDTETSGRNKQQRDYDTMIRKFASEEAGVYNEQQETADYIETLMQTETDQVLRNYLSKRMDDIRSRKEDV